MTKSIALAAGLVAILLATAAAAQDKPRVIGNWLTKVQLNDFSDDNTVIAINPHEDAKMAALAARCSNKELALLIMAPKQGYGKGDLFSIKIRPDRGEITTVRGAAMSGEGMVMAALSGEVLKSFFDAKSIAVRIEETSGETLDLKFASGKNREALGLVAKECGIK